MSHITYSLTSNGVFDCANTWKGTAYIDECGCIGGTTNITQCPGPFNGDTAMIPGIIQAEEYDFGGNGVSYYDTDAGNEGTATLRDGDDVDIQATDDSDGGYNVGWIASGEWLKYTVNVTSSGKYVVDFRVSSGRRLVDNSNLNLKMDGMTLFESPLEVPITGDWQTSVDWITITSDTIELVKGEQELTFEAIDGAFNIHFMEFRRIVEVGFRK